ncbi:50S ribosomal protein L18, partial [Candidatus Woesearchaeota archaeon CG_4_10_14_0_2_um_filter_57_5]
SRLVVRITGKNALAQAVVSEHGQDKVVVSAHSRELIGMGWQQGRKNLPAAYLVGRLAAKRCGAAGITDLIVDLGQQRSVKGSRIYALVKGVVDGGVVIPVDEKMFPSEERLNGTHIIAYHGSAKERFTKSDAAKLAEQRAAVLGAIEKS